MRVAALYDIHANLPALEAVLQEIRQSDVDQIVVGGDVVLGPMPLETLACLREVTIPALYLEGNCDRDVLAQMRGSEPTTLPEQVRGAIRWVAEVLEPEHERLLASWPKTVRLEIPGLGDVLFCHATPRNDTEIFTRLTAQERLLPAFADTQADVVVCGHTHMQFDRMIGRIRVVNAGSVGMPFGKRGADWLLLGPDVDLRHTDYDYAAAAQRIRNMKNPQAQEFADRNILHPPSEEEMLDLLGRAELK
jgi:putative phosphoesterase